jgi:CRISPR-associated protein Cas1
MIKRTLYFGNEAYLHTSKQQLMVSFSDPAKESVSIPIEDIGVVILDAFRLTISQTLISRLLHNNVALITCDERHHPQGLMLNLEGNTLQQERFKSQINASEPLRKNLWQQTVKAKIRNQAALLNQNGHEIQNMKYWENQVNSGDTKNHEGRAAAYFWKRLFSGYQDDFVRGRFEKEPNNLLNYGYAILRAVVARNLVASGLLPTFGIHHHNRYNAYALADDIMEPYRPYVDRVVLEILDKHKTVENLTPEIKKELLQIPVLDVTIEGQRNPLMVGMQQTTASLSACFAGETRKIKYPDFG